jgi:hypothetical protein
MPSDILPPDDDDYIYRPWFTRNGRRIYAKDFGKKAWKIRRRY